MCFFFGEGGGARLMHAADLSGQDSWLTKSSQATEKDGSVSKSSGEQHQKPSATKQWGHPVPLGHFFHKHVESDHSLLMLLTQIWRSTEKWRMYTWVYEMSKRKLWINYLRTGKNPSTGCMNGCVQHHPQWNKLPFAAGWWHSSSVLNCFFCISTWLKYYI